MRRVIYTALGAAALASASIANAAITVTNSSGVDASSITVVNSATGSTVDWAKNPQPAGGFNGLIEFTNTLSGMYQIIVASSTFGAVITNATLSGMGGSPVFSSASGNTTNSLTLGPTSALNSGNYRFTFGGSVPTSGVVSGNLTFQVVPVPEPATWAMMIVGFGAIGFALRRRRRPLLAQLA